MSEWTSFVDQNGWPVNTAKLPSWEQISTDDMERALTRPRPSPLAQLAALYTFFLYGPVRHEQQDRWGN